MPFYTKYQAQLERYFGEFSEVQSGVIAVAEEDAALAAGTLGGRVLAALAGNTFQQLFATFNAQTGAFVWNPAASGSYTFGRVLEALDGVRTSGECKIIAGALLGLWVFPPPFGLGQHASSPKASLYKFENYDSNEGFISHHPVGGVRGLRPNIMHPLGNAQDLNTRAPLYQWGDHKTVFYSGRLWDPSYQQIWNHERDMVAFQFTGLRSPADRDAYEVRVVTGDAAKGWLAGQLMFMRMDLAAGGWKGPYRAIG
jgi:hypothetical protein